MSQRRTFIEWILEKDVKPTPTQLLVAIQLDYVAHFMVERFPRRTGKTWILDKFEEYIKAQRELEGIRETNP